MKARSSIVALTLAFALGACGGETPPPVVPTVPPPTVAKVEPKPAPLETPDAPFRSQPPEKGDAGRPFVAPKVEEGALKNGILVLFVPHPTPTVSVSLVVRAGQGDVAQAKPWTLSFLGAMLEQGTKTRSALKLSDDFEAIGAHHDASFGWDSGALSVDGSASTSTTPSSSSRISRRTRPSRRKRSSASGPAGSPVSRPKRTILPR